MNPLKFSRETLLSCLALAASSLLILYCAPAQYLGRQQDDLLYIISSHALSSGHYRLFTVPGSPPLLMISPGFPALLLPLTWFAGERYGLYQAFSALIMAAIPWFLWAWLKKKTDHLSALFIAVLFATSPLILIQSGTVMSEGPYLLITLALLTALDRPDAGILRGALALLLTQVRHAGLSMMPAMLLRPILKKRWKETAWMSTLPLSGMILWTLWSRSVSTSHQINFRLWELMLSYGGQAGTRAWLVVLDNAQYYLGSWGSCYLPIALADGPAAVILGASLGVASIIGSIRLLRQDLAEPVVLMLAGALILHALWPYQYQRYLIPLLPWLLLTAALGFGRRGCAALALLLAAQLGFETRPWLMGPNSWTSVELQQTYGWIKSHSSPSDILASPMPVRDGFYATRPGLPLPDEKD